MTGPLSRCVMPPVVIADDGVNAKRRLQLRKLCRPYAMIDTAGNEIGSPGIVAK